MGQGCHINTVLWTGFMEMVTFEQMMKEMGGTWLAGIRRGQRTTSAKTLSREETRMVGA